MVKIHRFYVNWQYLVDGEHEGQWPEQSTTTLRYDLEPVATDCKVHQHPAEDPHLQTEEESSQHYSILVGFGPQGQPHNKWDNGLKVAFIKGHFHIRIYKFNTLYSYKLDTLYSTIIIKVNL